MIAYDKETSENFMSDELEKSRVAERKWSAYFSAGVVFFILTAPQYSRRPFLFQRPILSALGISVILMVIISALSDLWMYFVRGKFRWAAFIFLTVPTALILVYGLLKGD